MNWHWINKQALLLLHDESVAEHGGAGGLRGEGLLDSALARPLNLNAYGTPDFADLAASYAIGLAKNHAFVDGNSGYDVLRVDEVLPPTASDRSIIAEAAKDHRAVLTQDLYFSALIAVSGANCPSIIREPVNDRPRR